MANGIWRTLLLAITLGVIARFGDAQQTELKNPFQGDLKAIEQGRQSFRLGCASCHALDAKGSRGPDLTTGQWTHGGTDAQLFRVIMRGIPGTEMAGVEASDNTDDDVWMLIAYLRTLSGPRSQEQERGSAQNGEALFWGQAGCGRCHMISGRGGRLGPDLSVIGAARSRTALVTQIRTPSEYLTAGFATVTVVTEDGRRIRGAVKNEDPFSIQMMNTDEQILAFQKKDLREVVHDTRSLMPDYGRDRVTDAQLDDVIRYLRTTLALADSKK